MTKYSSRGISMEYVGEDGKEYCMVWMEIHKVRKK